MKIIRLAICSPNDVNKEVEIAKRVVDDLNQHEFIERDIVLKREHWKGDVAPNLSQRPQEVVNRKIIDSADVLIAIFWSRLGSPTGLFASGTEEEVNRALSQQKRVMLYFSNLNLPVNHNVEQASQLENFRDRIREQFSCECFNSREEFGKKLHDQLKIVVEELTSHTLPKSSPQTMQREMNTQLSQNINGMRVTQGNGSTVIGNIGGSFIVKTQGKHAKITMVPRLGSVSPEELYQVKAWIQELVDGEPRMSTSQAYGKWWSAFKEHFKLTKIEDLKSEKMNEVELWFQHQRKLQKVGYKTTAPDKWRKDKYAAIHTMMDKMEKNKEDYYLEIAMRLKMKTSFFSLKDLPKTTLERVYNLVRRDNSSL